MSDTLTIQSLTKQMTQTLTAEKPADFRFNRGTVEIHQACQQQQYDDGPYDEELDHKCDCPHPQTAPARSIGWSKSVGQSRIDTTVFVFLPTQKNI